MSTIPAKGSTSHLNGKERDHHIERTRHSNLLSAFAAELENITQNDSENVGQQSSMPPLPIEAHIDPSLAEGASTWLDDYIEFSRRWSPRSYEGFHEAVGLWVLSTVAARRVSLDFGGKRYTSLYIALATRTSIYAKSTAAKIGVTMINDAACSHLLASDDATPQAFVKRLAGHFPNNWSDMPREKQLAILERIASAGQRGWFFDEFGQKVSAMMREGGTMADYRGLLRKFDDNPEVYEYESITRGSDRVTAPYLALLANLTPADLRPFAKKGSALWGDGFWARFAFITAPPNAQRSKARFPEEERISPPSLVNKLKMWHKRLGIPSAKENAGSDGDGRGKDKATNDVIIDRPAPRSCILGDGVFDASYDYADALLDIVEQSPNQDLRPNQRNSYTG